MIDLMDMFPVNILSSLQCAPLCDSHASDFLPLSLLPSSATGESSNKL